MRATAIVLLLGVFIAHDSAYWLSSARYSPAAVFYMMQGAWSATLALCLLDYIYREAVSLGRTVGMAACIIAVIEGMQMVVWRLAITDIRQVPAGMSLGDFVTGMPVSIVTKILEVCIVAWLIASHFRRED